MTSAAARIFEHVKKWRSHPTPTMHGALVRYHLRTLAGCWSIIDQEKESIPLYPNESQLRLRCLMMDMAEQERPIRIKCLKARKTGASTDIQVLHCDICAHHDNQKALTLAHEASATREIFEIATHAAKHYRYHDGSPAADTNTWDIRFSGTNSSYRCQTAGAVAVGSGGTPSMLHLSEHSKWERNKRETYTSAMDSLPDNPLTICIDESTAKGRDEFWYQWEAAAEPDNPFEQLFIPWFVDDRLQLQEPPGFRVKSDEEEIVRRAASQGIVIGPPHLQWRRQKIAVLGSEADFRQEYPSTPQEAVQSVEGLILPDARGCVIDELPIPYEKAPRDAYVGGIDYGYSDTDATVIWAGLHHRETVYLTHYWRAFGSLAKERAEALLDGHRYFDDPSGLESRKELLRAAGLLGRRCNIRPAPRTRSPGEDVATVELHLLASWMATGRVKVLSSVSQQLIVEADSFCWNPKTGKADDTRGSAWGHFDTIFALKYLVMGLARRPVAVEYEERRYSRAEQMARM